MLTQCSSAERIVYEVPQAKISIEAGICLGIVNGVRSTMQIYESELKPERRLCWPAEGVTVGQGVLIVNKYLKDHPEKLHEDETVLIIKAFRLAFQCK